MKISKILSENDVAMIDPMKMNYALYKNIPCKTVECANPTILMKAMKNPVELENIKEAHIKDGVAITKFMYWIKNPDTIKRSSQSLALLTNSQASVRNKKGISATASSPFALLRIMLP